MQEEKLGVTKKNSNIKATGFLCKMRIKWKKIHRFEVILPFFKKSEKIQKKINVEISDKICDFTYILQQLDR